MTATLSEAIEASDVGKASQLLKEDLGRGADAWAIHLSLYPIVQRVMNPPFINPHLPKMHCIYRELVRYLEKDDIPGLVRLEVNEYAKRPKLPNLPEANRLTSPVSFMEVESAIRERDWDKTSVLMAAFSGQKGGTELARRLLLLGSGYLDHSLGHSVSCTAFILLEMIERADQDPWPALATLADYFCKGRFDTTPGSDGSKKLPSDEELNHHMLRATSGRGILNLHHTITRYAIERARPFFSHEEYCQLIDSWIKFLGEKEADRVNLGHPEWAPGLDYDQFYKEFSRLEAKSAMASMPGMFGSEVGLRQLGRFLIKGVCDQYRGDYDPHYLTGLGSALWTLDRYRNQPSIAVKALFQYVDFFFGGLKSED